MTFTAKTDFYQYVNKKWLEDPDNKIPNEYSRWGGFIKLHDTGLINQINLVSDLYKKEVLSEEEKKISAIWEASEKRFARWKDGTADYMPIERELEILDAIFAPNNPISETDHTDLPTRVADYLHYTQINGIGNVFNFDKGSDLLQSNNFVLDFATSGLSLPCREYYTESNFLEKRELFKLHLMNIAKIINSNCSTILDNDFVENVLHFEQTIASYKMKQEQTREYDKYFTNTNLTELYSKINNLVSLPAKEDNYLDKNFILTDNQIKDSAIFFERIYKLFDLRNILKVNRQKYFLDKGIINAPHEEHVTAYDGDAIRRVLALVLNKDNLSYYRSFLQYKTISAFKGFCTQEIDDEFFDFYSRKLNGQLEQKPEIKRSIQVVNNYAEEMMGKVYVDHYFPEAYKKDIREVIQEIVDIMKVSIKSNDWLTETTKTKSLQKLEKFNIKVGYPDIWKDYSDFDIKEGDSLYDISKKANKWALKYEFFNKINSVLDRNEWLMTPQTVNAYFMPTQNEIVFPAAILQPPFYCKSIHDIDFDYIQELTLAYNHDIHTDFVNATNFGGIGAVIAHEITHGYDDKGRKFDGDGNLNDWWTPEDANLFIAKTRIMAEQVEKYSFIDHDNSNKEYKLNAQLTMGENLADLGGISLALRAMTHRLKNKGFTKEYIEINQRILFKSFANIWKQNTKKDYIINQLTTDPHSPSDFRANLVKNMDEFYTVFNITENDPMYIAPEKRVRMW